MDVLRELTRDVAAGNGECYHDGRFYPHSASTGGRRCDDTTDQ
jgi:hypothetical protein